MRALRSARRLIYLENQFLWSAEIASILGDKLERPPADDFRLLIVLPAKPNNGNDDTRGVLAELTEADAGAGRLLACTLFARAGRLADPVYVHAKLGIVDDSWLTIGSANLNEHSLFNDTEMNLVTRDAALARQTRLRLWAEHLELPLEQGRRRPGARDRRAVEAGQRGAGRASHRRRAAHPSAGAPAPRLPSLGTAAPHSRACSSTAEDGVGSAASPTGSLNLMLRLAGHASA